MANPSRSLTALLLLTGLPVAGGCTEEVTSRPRMVHLPDGGVLIVGGDDDDDDDERMDEDGMEMPPAMRRDGGLPPCPEGQIRVPGRDDPNLPTVRVPAPEWIRSECEVDHCWDSRGRPRDCDVTECAAIGRAVFPDYSPAGGENNRVVPRDGVRFTRSSVGKIEYRSYTKRRETEAALSIFDIGFSRSGSLEQRLASYRFDEELGLWAVDLDARLSSAEVHPDARWYVSRVRVGRAVHYLASGSQSSFGFSAGIRVGKFGTSTARSGQTERAMVQVDYWGYRRPRARSRHEEGSLDPDAIHRDIQDLVEGGRLEADQPVPYEVVLEAIPDRCLPADEALDWINPATLIVDWSRLHVDDFGRGSDEDCAFLFGCNDLEANWEVELECRRDQIDGTLLYDNAVEPFRVDVRDGQDFRIQTIDQRITMPLIDGEAISCYLDGIVDVEGRGTEPLSSCVAFGARYVDGQLEITRNVDGADNPIFTGGGTPMTPGTLLDTQQFEVNDCGSGNGFARYDATIQMRAFRDDPATEGSLAEGL